MLGNFTVFHLFIFSLFSMLTGSIQKACECAQNVWYCIFIQKHKKLSHNHTIHTETVQSDNMYRQRILSLLTQLVLYHTTSCIPSLQPSQASDTPPISHK